MRHQTTRRCLGLLRGAGAIAALIALVGCGVQSSVAAVDSPAASSTSTHSITATRSGTSRSAAGVAIDRRIASDARLRLTDLPHGWVATTKGSLTSDSECRPITGAQAAVSAHKSSPLFVTRGGVRTAESAAYIYADTATAVHWFGELSTPGTRVCVARVLRMSLGATVRGEGVTVGPVTTRSVALAPVGDERAASRITVRVSGHGLSIDADVDLVFVRVGRGIAIFALGAVGSPFDPALEARVVKTVTNRLAADLRRAS